MPINNCEKLGIQDLFLGTERNGLIVIQIARSITKNLCGINTAANALEYIYTHLNDSRILLNKRHITKEILYQYLHSRKVAISSDFTKLMLIDNVLDYWNSSAFNSTNFLNQVNEQEYQSDAEKSRTIEWVKKNTYNEQINLEIFPIHLLAKQFSEWFFSNYNKGELQTEDFWKDASLNLRIIANDYTDDRTCNGVQDIIQTLISSKSFFGFYFNPNLTVDGVQGRMDTHGLVLVLSCGTLHRKSDCVGVFECTFGLIRDPHAKNNWKVRNMKCFLRSEIIPCLTHTLTQSLTQQDALALPITTHDGFS